MITYFDCLGVEPVFELDQAQLATQYRQRQANALDAAQQAHFNQAYTTLSQDDQRAAYLLRLVNQHQGLDQSIGDLDFLQHALELRISLEEASQPAELEAIHAEAEQWRQALSRDFSREYATQDWPEARNSARKLAFIQKVLVDVRQQQDRLDESEWQDDF